MEESAQALDIYVRIVSLVIPAIGGYLIWLHMQVMGLKIDMAVNTAKDGEVWKHLEKQESMLEEIKKDIQEIKQDLAYQKGNNKR